MDTASIVNAHYQDLYSKYPGLQLYRQINNSWLVAGRLSFTARYQGQQLDDDYDIEILLSPAYPSEIPQVREIGHRIPNDFHHSGEFLCLGEQGELILRFREQPNLLGFIDNCLVPYLYNFSHQAKFGGPLPLGELSHGWLGILEHYQEVFGINDRTAVLALLQLCAEKDYNGHSSCPCGSKRRLRRCHGKVIQQLIAQVPALVLKREYYMVYQGIKGIVK